jgi:hypothetical protein
MTDDELSKYPAYRWMPSRIPLRDALTTFVADAPEPEPIIAEMSSRGESVWVQVQGGHRVLFRYDGGAFDQSRFTLEPKVWDYDECAICGEHIASMMLCHVTEPQQPYVLLCERCYERHVISKSLAA